MNKAKNDMSESIALGYITDVEKQLALNSINDPYYEYPTYVSDPSEFSTKETAPDSILLFINEDTGTVESGTLTYDGVKYRYYNGEISKSEY